MIIPRCIEITDPRTAVAWDLVGVNVYFEFPENNVKNHLGPRRLLARLEEASDYFYSDMAGKEYNFKKILVPIKTVFKNELPSETGWYYVRNKLTGKVTPSIIEINYPNETDVLVSYDIGPKINGCL